MNNVDSLLDKEPMCHAEPLYVVMEKIENFRVADIELTVFDLTTNEHTCVFIDGSVVISI